MASDVYSIGKRYIDKYKYFEGKSKINGNSKYKIASEDMVQDFITVLKISPSFMYFLSLTESPAQFFKSFKSAADIFPEEYREDLFFTAKLCKRMKLVPSKLLYIMQKAVDMYRYPNLAMSAIPSKYIAEFCYEDSLTDVTILDILCNICKSEVKLLSPYRRRSQFGDCVEVYVQSDEKDELVDRVALIPLDVSNVLSDKEVSNITFDTKRGLISGDLVLRTVAGHAGITFYDFDLRELL